MRTIKYRGRDKVGEWQVGNLVVHPTGKTFIVSYRREDPLWYEVDAKSVGQFTGLTDANGKEIYEGDMVCNDKYQGIVKWMPGKCCYQISPGGVFLTKSCTVKE